MKTVTVLSEKLAHDCDWNGDIVCEVFLEALTDANFHDLKKILKPIILKYFEPEIKTEV